MVSADVVLRMTLTKMSRMGKFAFTMKDELLRCQPTHDVLRGGFSYGRCLRSAPISFFGALRARLHLKRRKKPDRHEAAVPPSCLIRTHPFTYDRA
jgi:hypothetical protein